MNALKKKIKNSRLPLTVYQDCRQLADTLLSQLKSAIETDFPIFSTQTSPIEKENAVHRNFAESRVKVYVGREENLAPIDQYVRSSSSTKPLLLVGESGVGKTCLLSYWTFNFEKNDITTSNQSLLIKTFVGASNDSTDHVKVMRRIMQMVKSSFSLTDEIPKEEKEIGREFPRFLKQLVPKQRKLIVVLDAVDQFSMSSGEAGAHLLAWLPDSLPSNVKLIVSTQSQHTCHIVAEKRAWNSFTLSPLSVEEKRQLATVHLSLYAKKLSEQQMQLLLQSKQTRNPLFLITLLNELRVFGVFEELTSKMESYLLSKSVQDLFVKIVKRLSSDYTHPSMVRDTFSLLFTSRDGLTFNELVQILKIPKLTFTPFFHSIQSLLVKKEGSIFHFHHPSLFTAVEKVFLRDEIWKQKYRLKLADYFECTSVLSYDSYGPKALASTDPSFFTPVSSSQFREEESDLFSLERKAFELTHALTLAKEHFRLRNALSDVATFGILYSYSKYELKKLWLPISKLYSISQAYSESIQNFSTYEVQEGGEGEEELSLLYTYVGKFLKEVLDYQGAEIFHMKALQLKRKLYGEKSAQAATSLYHLAQLNWNDGKFEKAEVFCLESLEIREKVVGGDHLKTAKCLCGLGE